MDDIEQLLLMLSYTEHPVSFEIIATSTSIGIQFTCRESDASHVYGQCQAYFPAAVITKSESGLDILADGPQTCVIDFGLSDEFMRPLRLASEVDQDPKHLSKVGVEFLFKKLRGEITNKENYLTPTMYIPIYWEHNKLV